MGTAANQAKARWNAKHYTQVKVSVDPELASAFKSACEEAGKSMASVISAYMAGYIAAPASKPPVDTLSTKRKRRNAVTALIGMMEQIRDAEERSMENIPENLHGAGAYEAAGESISVMEEILELMGAIY